MRKQYDANGTKINADCCCNLSRLGYLVSRR